MLSKKTILNLQEKKKTRFPLSRIKKISQEDENIGKTSSTVPVALSKACELFIEEIINSLKEKKKINSKDIINKLEKYTLFTENDFKEFK